MQIVIDIPEELKSEIDSADEYNYQATISWYDTTLYDAIKNGTPLPKGHGDLIDGSELLKQKVRFEDFDGDTYYIIHEETVINACAYPIIEADKEESEAV